MADEIQQNSNQQKTENYRPWPDYSKFREEYNLINETDVRDKDDKRVATLAKLSELGGNRQGTDAVYVEVVDPRRAQIIIEEKGVEVSDSKTKDSSNFAYFTDDSVLQGSNMDRHIAKFVLRSHDAPISHDTHIIAKNLKDTIELSVAPAHTNGMHDMEAEYKPSITFNNAVLDVQDNRVLGTQYIVKAGQKLILTMPLPEKILEPLTMNTKLEAPDYFERKQGFEDNAALITPTSVAKHNAAQYIGKKEYTEEMPIQLDVSFQPAGENIVGEPVMPKNIVLLPNGAEIHMQENAKLELMFIDQGKIIHSLQYTSKLGETKENPKKDEYHPDEIGIAPKEDRRLFVRAHDVIRDHLIEREKLRETALKENTEQYETLKKELQSLTHSHNTPGVTVDGVQVSRENNILYIEHAENSDTPVTMRGEYIYIGKESHQSIRKATQMIDDEGEDTHSQHLEETLRILQDTKPTLDLKGIDFIVLSGSEHNTKFTIAGDGNTYLRHKPLRIMHDKGKVDMEVIGNDREYTATRYDNYGVTIENANGDAMNITMPARYAPINGLDLIYNEDRTSKVVGISLGDKKNEVKVILSDNQPLDIFTTSEVWHSVVKNRFSGELFDEKIPGRYYHIEGGADGDETKTKIREQYNKQQDEAPAELIPIQPPAQNPPLNQPAPPPPAAPAAPLQFVTHLPGLEGVSEDILNAAVIAAKSKEAESFPRLVMQNSGKGSSLV